MWSYQSKESDTSLVRRNSFSLRKGKNILRRCLSKFQLPFLTLIVFLSPLTTTDSCAEPVGRGNRSQQVVTMKNASGGRELVFGTTTDLGILRVFHENDESAGALIRLNKPQTIFVRNGFVASRDWFFHKRKSSIAQTVSTQSDFRYRP